MGIMTDYDGCDSKEGKTGHKPKFNKARRNDWKRGMDY
jgi:hypothetical protein